MIIARNAVIPIWTKLSIRHLVYGVMTQLSVDQREIVRCHIRYWGEAILCRVHNEWGAAYRRCLSL